MIDRKTLIRRLSFTAYFIAAFFIFLLLQFPFDRVKSKIESEVRARTPVELSIGRISPRFFNSFLLSDVVVSDRQGKVLFESQSVSASVSLFNLIWGGLGVNMDAAAYGGKLFIKLRQGPGQQYVMLDASGLEVEKYTALSNLGFRIAGRIGGNFEMNNDSGQGRLWVKNVTSRELKIKGFSVPDLDFDDGWLEADIKGDRLIIRKLALNGKELKIRATGDLVLRERGTLNLSVRLKPSERLAHEQSALLAFLKDRDAEGFYKFYIGGLVTQPMPRF